MRGLTNSELYVKLKDKIESCRQTVDDIEREIKRKKETITNMESDIEYLEKDIIFEKSVMDAFKKQQENHPYEGQTEE